MQKKYGYGPQDGIEGRLIVREFQNEKNETVCLYLFTNLEVGSVQELIDLYKARWNIEEDIKRIKLQLRLRGVEAEIAASVIVEIFCKLMAYTLTRGVVLMAVHQTDINPRRISFTIAWAIIQRGFSDYSAQTTQEGKDRVLDEMLQQIREAKIPFRPNRNYPRQVYAKRPGRYKTISSVLR